ncbi:response regulator [Bacillus marinisedimentorum]|uniref:response regulator n=1 Tax=Bacillus marinisedimentorum TaxID=1821260 RepID=UPI0009F590C0|nr:response regulator [Bacillus marinisedimentorum]
MVCDDSLLIRKKLTGLLNSIGAESVIEAENGLEAVQKAQNSEIDLIFMDIVMPEMDGVEAVRHIKAGLPDAYIVMVSSVGTQKNLMKALKAGASDFIQKPFQEDSIRQIIAHFQKERGVHNV